MFKHFYLYIYIKIYIFTWDLFIKTRLNSVWKSSHTHTHTHSRYAKNFKQHIWQFEGNRLKVAVISWTLQDVSFWINCSRLVNGNNTFLVEDTAAQFASQLFTIEETIEFGCLANPQTHDTCTQTHADTMLSTWSLDRC